MHIIILDAMLFFCSNLEKTDIKQRKKKKKILEPKPELEPINLFPGADIKIYPQHYWPEPPEL